MGRKKQQEQQELSAAIVVLMVIALLIYLIYEARKGNLVGEMGMLTVLMVALVIMSVVVWIEVVDRPLPFRRLVTVEKVSETERDASSDDSAIKFIKNDPIPDVNPEAPSIVRIV